MAITVPESVMQQGSAMLYNAVQGCAKLCKAVHLTSEKSRDKK